MEDRLGRSGLRFGAGIFSVLILIGAGDCPAKSSFKNTPLYRHIVRRRRAEPVRLYEAKPAASAEPQRQEQTKEAKPAEMNAGGGEIEKSRTVYEAKSRAAALADPSSFTPDMPFGEAIDILRNSIAGGLNIVVLWKDLEEKADIFFETPIGIDGVSGVPLSRHLKSLLDGVSGASPERLGYVVDEGVIVVATEGSLPKMMVTRVYDITDLTGQPAQYGGIQGLMMSRMVGMMSGNMGGMGGMGMQGGFGMPFGGGLGMQGGLMGGYGGFGGGFGTNLGLGGTSITPYR